MRILMVAGTLVAAGAPLWVAHEQRWTGAEYGFTASYAALLAAAGVLACLRSTGAQLLARSVWWSAFGGGVLMAVFAPDVRELSGMVMALVLGPATSLLAAGRTGLEGRAGEFAAGAYRAPIMVSMIMALADAQALGWLGALHLYDAMHSHYASHQQLRWGMALLGCSALALVALYGLYRLRLWGLVVSATTTLAIGVLAFTPVLGLADAGPVPYALALSAAVQLTLLAPVFVSVARGRPPRPTSARRARIAALVPVAVIVVLVALSVITVATGRPLVKF